jgi:hypothetical protein
VRGATTDSKTPLLTPCAALSTGGLHQYCVTANTSAAALKATLVWHDYYATPAAAIALVNDLHLLVQASGVLAVGNQAQRDGAVSFDTLNNVESAVVGLDGRGVQQVTVSVIGASVPQGPQPYALVVAGALDANAACGGVCMGPCADMGGLSLCLCRVFEKREADRGWWWL